MSTQCYVVFRVPRLDQEELLFIAPFTHSAACPLATEPSIGLANFMAGASPTEKQPCIYDNAAVELVTADTVEACPLDFLQRIWARTFARGRDEAIQEARASISRIAKMLAEHPVRRSPAA